MSEVLPPKLAKRREHKKATFVAGRTIGEKREKLETKKERAAARKKDKNKKAIRIVITIIGFLAIVGILVALLSTFFHKNDELETEVDEISYETTIEIVDEGASHGGQITARMREFIGQMEADLKEFDIKAIKAVIPTGSIRQVNFYIDGKNGYIKTTIDRGAGVTSEDISRMLKYLSGTGVEDFEYIDVRIEGKAYWK